MIKARSATRDMTSGNIYLHMLGFALPVFISEFFQQLYNTADALIVGIFLDNASFAAVTASGTLIFLLVSFFTGTAMGAGVVIAKYFGAGDHESVSRAIHTVIALGLVCGVVLTAVGVSFTPVFLKWMNTDESVLPKAVEYFRYYFIGAVSMVMYNVCRSIMNALGDSKRPLFYLIFSSVLNVTLDLIFIAWLRFGVWSAAVATVISQTASMILCFIHLLRRGKIYTVTIKKIRFHKDMFKEIIRYGLPSGVQNSVIGLANVIVQSQINSFGELATSGYGAYAKVEGFAFLPITSFSMASTTFIGQNLGAKEYGRAKKGALFSIISAVIAAEIIGLIYYFTAPYLIGIFNNNPEVIAYGVRQARTVSLFFCLLAFSHSVAAVCRGAGKTFVPMIIMLTVWCVIRIAYILTVMHFTGEIGYIYWAYPITWGISSIIYLLYYLFSDWAHGFEKKVKENGGSE